MDIMNVKSMQLWMSLSQERACWEFKNCNFTAQRPTVVADRLLCVGYVADISYFDEHVRTKPLQPTWMDAFDNLRWDFKRQLPIIEYLSRHDDQENGGIKAFLFLKPWI